MKPLTSRERVRVALNHEEPDRVPVDFGASRITGIGAIAYRKLLRQLGLTEDIRVYDVKQQLAQPSLAVINRLGGDVVQLNRLGPTSGMAFLESFLAVVGPYIEAIQMNDDFGTQDSLQISPTHYRELFKPRQRKWIEFVKARTRAKVFLHCDGAIEPIIPDFMEIGIDVLNPLQTSARGMDPAVIKRKYGRKLSFWGGGVETQTTLPFGTVDDIRREVRARVELLGQGGGYVFATIHNIQPDIPPEKVLAIYDTVTACAGRG